METNSEFSPLLWKDRFVEANRTLLRFARNPVAQMGALPDWDWNFLLICQAIAAASAGVLAGLVSRNFMGVIAGLIFVPLSNALMTAVLSGILYYFFAYAMKQVVPYRSIYTHFVFAQLPGLCTMIVAPLFAPLILVGVAASCLLLWIGLSLNHKLEKKTLGKVIVAFYAVFIGYWIFSQIGNRNKVEALRSKATPESLDILEKELNDSK